jgi:hypothetical protein
VELDTDDDEDFDYAVVGFDAGFVTELAFSGQGLATLVVDIEAQEVVAAHPAASSMNSGVVGLVFLLSEVGLEPGQREEFSYTARISSLENLGDDTIDATASYNPFTQPVETNVVAVVEPTGPSATLTLAVDREQLARTPVKGWLLYSPFNRSGPEQALTVHLRP